MKLKLTPEQIPLLRGMKPETIENLYEQGEVRQMGKGDICFRAREETVNIYVLIRGKAIVYNLTNEGQRKILYILGAGKLLNENVMANHLPSDFCEIIEPSKVFVIRKEYFVQFMEQDYELTRNIMVSHERRIWRLSHQLKNTTGGVCLERKLAAKLWKLARDFGKKTPEGIQIEISMSITFLADLMGAPRETVSRLCKNLVNKGLIYIERKRVTVIDEKGLVEFYKKGKCE